MKRYLLLALTVLLLLFLPLTSLSGCGGDGDDEIECKGEGETIPVIASPPGCCEGLDLIPPKSPEVLGVMGICTGKCGDGVCDPQTESSYNCPQDCPAEISGKQTYAKMVYKIGYGDAFDVAYMGSPTIETQSGIESYVWDVTFDPPLARTDKTGMSLEINGGSMGFSRTGLDLTLFQMNVTTMGFDVTVSQNYTFESDNHGAPFTVGQKWSTDELTKFEPAVMPEVVATYDVEVVGLEEVSVPAGTFECYKVVYTIVADNGVPVDTLDRQSTFWWDAHSDFLLIKIEDMVNFELPMIYEVVSLTEDYLAP